MPTMTEAQALKIMADAIRDSRKVAAFSILAKKIGVPFGTLYHWHREQYIPEWRLPAFDKLKKRRVA